MTTSLLIVFFPPLPPHLSAKDAVNHDNDETLQGVEDSEEDLEECGATVGDGQDSRHPGEGQEGQNHAGAPKWCPARGARKD